MNRSPVAQYITHLNGQQLDAPIVLQPGEELAMPTASFSYETNTVGTVSWPGGGFGYRVEWEEP